MMDLVFQTETHQRAAKWSHDLIFHRLVHKHGRRVKNPPDSRTSPMETRRRVLVWSGPVRSGSVSTGLQRAGSPARRCSAPTSAWRAPSALRCHHWGAGPAAARAPRWNPTDERCSWTAKTNKDTLYKLQNPRALSWWTTTLNQNGSGSFLTRTFPSELSCFRGRSGSARVPSGKAWRYKHFPPKGHEPRPWSKYLQDFLLQRQEITDQVRPEVILDWRYPVKEPKSWALNRWMTFIDPKNYCLKI